MTILDNIFVLKLYRSFQHTNISIVLVLFAGCSMLCVSMLPWLKDPLGETYSAWQLPIYFGWSDRISFFNYGLLCLTCAFSMFLLLSPDWRLFKRYHYLVYRYKVLHFISIIPVVLFLFQYLCADISTIALLNRHEREMLLIQQYFGYRGSVQLIILKPFSLNISTLWEKLKLLLDCVSYGPLFLGLTGCFLSAHCYTKSPQISSPGSRSKYRLIVFCCIAFLMLLFIRIPIGMMCEYGAKEELSIGNYTLTLQLLDAARFFNPDFDQVAYYHIEKGQAQYFLLPGQLTTDSRIYLASTYRTQGDLLDAYQQLTIVQQANPKVPWITDEIDITLERLVEAKRPLRASILYRVNADDTALPWLYTLIKVDPSSFYTFYVVGRIQYDLHNYNACITYMSSLLKMKPKENIRSSIYTYQALSEIGLGNYKNARLLLFEAVSIDPGYHNNTAHEELSGLH